MSNSWHNLQEGDIVDLRRLVATQKFTKPPSRYSQASLIKKLEELGIGRPSTYASIISTLQERAYVESQKSQMKPTTLGMQVNNLLSENFEQVTNSDLTAEMENNLDDVSHGTKTYEEVLSTFWHNLKKQVESHTGSIMENRDKYKQTKTSELCPTCQSPMIIKIGRFGEYFECEQGHQHSINYKEYQKALLEAQNAYSHLTHQLFCEECKEQTIVRVSKSGLKPYIACPQYRVGNKHSIFNIQALLGIETKPRYTKKNSAKPKGVKKIKKKLSPSAKKRTS